MLQERWHAIEEVLKWRRKERQVMAERDAQQAAAPAAGPARDAYPMRSDYAAEPFSVRRKEFWPLTYMQKLLSSFIPNLSHESDGLIFQVSCSLCPVNFCRQSKGNGPAASFMCCGHCAGLP